MKSNNCPKCNAPLDSNGNCPFCGYKKIVADETKNILTEDDPTLNYPKRKCVSAHFNFNGTLFPLIIAVVALFFGSFAILSIINIVKTKDLPKIEAIFEAVQQYLSDPLSFLFLFFFILGIIFLIVFLKRLFAIITVSLLGKEVAGTVLKYSFDNVSYNSARARICHILISDSGEEFVIPYRLYIANTPFPIGSKLELKRYGKYYKIINNNYL